jgi:ferredoxin-NADP reductase
MIINTVYYTVVRTKKESADIFSLWVTLPNGLVPTYIPGQYIVVYFPEQGIPEGKAYSIASAPQEGALMLTVRAMGSYSNQLSALKPGDTVRASLPYGYFYSESDATYDLALVAAGIGIVPFRGMLMGASPNVATKKVSAYWSVRAIEDAVFKKDFDANGVSCTYFVTREELHEVAPNILLRRMSPVDIVERVTRPASTEFLICGSIGFVRDMWRGLQKLGIRPDMLLTEAFYK